MSSAQWALVLTSVALGSLAQLLLKVGSAVVAPGSVAGSAGWIGRLLAAAASPWVLGGLILYAASALLWIIVLSRLDLTVAYPLVALGFVFTTLLGVVALGEPLTASRIGGIALIALGCALVARSA